MTHLSIEQCVKLKEIGFPQGTTDFSLVNEGTLRVWTETINPDYHEAYACPTLSEIIEWLGDRFVRLVKWEDAPGYRADGKVQAKRKGFFHQPQAEGPTPIIAVYHLAAAIHDPIHKPNY